MTAHDSSVDQEPKATGPGIVVMAPSRVTYMNRQAMVLLNQLEHPAQSVGPERTVAAPLHQHCRDINETLQTRLASNNWEEFELCRTIGDSTHTISLEGSASLTAGACPNAES